LLNCCRFLIKVFSLTLVICALVAAWYWYNRIDEQICRKVTSILSDHYPGLSVSLNSARRIEGEGIVLRGLKIRDPAIPGRWSELLKIDEILIACRTGVPDLIQNDLQVEHVTVRRLAMQTCRRKDGHWSIQRLWPPPPQRRHRPIISFEQSSIEILDGPSVAKKGIKFNNIQMSLRHLPDNLVFSSAEPVRHALSINGTAAGDFFHRLQWNATYDPATSRWKLKGRVVDARIDNKLHANVPAGWRTSLSALSTLRARANFHFEADLPTTLKPAGLFQMKGNIEEGQYNHSLLPYPISDLQASFHVTGQKIEISDIQGRCGETNIQLSCNSKNVNGPYHLKGRIEGLHLDENLARALPKSARQTWNDFQPAGEVDAEIENLTIENGHYRGHVLLHSQNLSFTYHKFPYRLDRGTGTLIWNEKGIQVNLAAKANDQTVEIRGHIHEIRPAPSGWIEVVGSEPIPIDSKLLSAFRNKSQPVIRALQPRGQLTFSARYERNNNHTQKLKRRVIVKLSGCSMKYDRFQYSLSNIHGTIEMVDGVWSFRDLVGQNGGGLVTCVGQWHPHLDGGQLALEFTGKKILLGQELYGALSPRAQQLWSDIRPNGVVDHLYTKILYKARYRRTSLEVNLEKFKPTTTGLNRNITIQPVWFPYRIEQLTGAIHYHDGHITLNKLRGVHGNTRLSTNGKCFSGPGKSWQVELNDFVIERARTDREFISALPSQLGRAVSKLEIQGPLNIRGKMKFQSGDATDAPPQSYWDLTLDLANTGINCGMQLGNIYGTIQLTGASNQQGIHCRGNLSLDSLMYEGTQLTQVHGPLWIDPSRVLFGSWAETPRPDQPPQQLSATVYGGTLRGNAQITLPECQFKLMTSLSAADLTTIAREKIGPTSTLSGKTFANLNLSGVGKSRHTLRGNGMIRLRDADIYELPVMVSLLKLVRIQPPDRTAFTTSDIDFRVNGEHIYIERIDFRGDLFSLKGSGEIGLDHKINLNFYTLVGPDQLQLPVLRPVLGEASRQVLAINATGTLRDPVTENRPFPGLNDTIQQLFPGEAPRQARRWSEIFNPREAARTIRRFPGN